MKSYTPFKFYFKFYIDIKNGIYNLNYLRTLYRIGIITPLP